MSRARWAAAGLLTLVAGCGVPTGGAAETIPASDVPYGLASPAPTSPAPADPDPVVEPGRVYLVDAADLLVPRPREVEGATPEERLGALLDALAAGPTAEERDRQLSTALPPEVRLSVVELAGGTATVDITGAPEAPAGQASRRAVAQVVLSATSVPGIEAVVLTWDGERVEAPLPSGELTAEPLTRADYAGEGRPAPPS
ncbi:GerMN domain-containing protein [Geodermatophilus sp. DSM 45219]|uniref:GerMN domain-containing protein n=1 Tax=Geodermatophilus sp. DSM 45219 TaxID=1881103 RepID=UPI000888FD0D|nr:GerMN domain-containing protein [Geodermatophilus sp. DSM 45219]SDN56792.1 Sporulation and spore germination [Geodermatophilus sp. DSM 45219]